MAANVRPSDPVRLDPADVHVLAELAAQEAAIAADVEAQRAAADVVADLQLLLARAIALSDVSSMEAMRTQINVASFDEALALARKRAAPK